MQIGYIAGHAGIICSLLATAGNINTPYMPLFVGGAAVGAALSFVRPAVSNLKEDDLKRAGSAIKDFGQSIIDGATSVGKHLGLVAKDSSPVATLVDMPKREGSYWGATVTEGLRKLIEPTGVAAGFTGAAMLLMSFKSYDPLPMMIAAAGLGALYVGSGIASGALENATKHFNKPEGSFKDAVLKVEVEKPAVTKDKPGPQASELSL